MKTEPLIINLAGGPGAGKSTTAAGLFHLMKLQKMKVELVTEYAKDLTYEAPGKLGNQLYVLGKQHNRMWRLKDKVDYIVTDSPLFLSAIYTNEDWIKTTAIQAFFSFERNFNIRLLRTKDYAAYGRSQTEDQARELDAKIQTLMDTYCSGNYIEVPGDAMAPATIMEKLNAYVQGPTQ